jgi:single-strand DNA-binding protein
MNKVVLLGRLTKDIEMKYTNNNTAVASFTLAVNRRFAKEGQQTADFINCQAWQKTAEFMSKYMAKGSQIAVEGRIQTRSWDDAEGKKRYVTEVVVENCYFADSKKGDADDSGHTKQNNKSQNNDGFFPIDDDCDLPF